MSWMQKLYQTYELCKELEQEGVAPLLPVSHAFQQAHIEITIDIKGNFESAKVIAKIDTPIPATEKSAGRTANCAPHPLCDKVQYCAGDYADFGGEKRPFFDEYQRLLTEWCSSSDSHPKAKAVLSYIEKRCLVADLIKERVMHVGENRKLLASWTDETPKPEIFKVLVANGDQGDALIRWQVRDPENPRTEVWLDGSLQEAWARFDASTKVTKGLCMVTGELESSLAASHPRRIRHPGDGAKIISANDSSGFTFRGRFTDDTGLQASGVGYQATQKAHNALRWLIQRQAYRNGDQVIVSWAVKGTAIPDPLASTFGLLEDETETIEVEDQKHISTDVGQSFAHRLNLKLHGYSAKLGKTDDIVVMGLDSATPGRMAITYYRELTGSEFLARIEHWHSRYAWYQNFSKDKQFIGAPAPYDIAEVAYGRRLDDKLKKSVIERLLPSLIDGQPLPRDLLKSVIFRACNRVSLEHWEWEKCLGIACSLYRGFHKKEEYQMSLETERRNRDYLYGRLLAVADRIESLAINISGERRDTAAAKLMQRFADRPASTWRTIELALTPAKSRLRSKRGGAMHNLDKLHDEIMTSFQSDDFLNDSKLSGEFLLGYHCQRRELVSQKLADAEAVLETTNE